jgi:hypothetical protein
MCIIWLAEPNLLDINVPQCPASLATYKVLDSSGNLTRDAKQHTKKWLALFTLYSGQNYALQTKEMVKRLAIVLSKTRDIPSILKGITRHMSNSVSFLPTRVPTKYLQGKIGLDFYKR